MEDKMKDDDDWPPAASYDGDNINTSALSMEKFIKSNESLTSNSEVGHGTRDKTSIKFDVHDSMV